MLLDENYVRHTCIKTSPMQICIFRISDLNVKIYRLLELLNHLQRSCRAFAAYMSDMKRAFSVNLNLRRYV